MGSPSNGVATTEKANGDANVSTNGTANPTPPAPPVPAPELQASKPAPFAPIDPPGPTRTGLVYNSIMLMHKHPAEDHPEAPRRIAHIFHLLKTSGYVARMVRVPSREAKRNEIRRVHTEEVVNGVYNSAFLPLDTLKENSYLLERESSLYLNEYSALCARFSAGSLIEMCDAVVSGRIRNGFAVIRPPGHHAEPNRSMGFCLFNNVAIATRAMQDTYASGPNAVKRVMIIDWDVHHGNGTQAVFNSDKSVLYTSLHRYEDGSFYPGGPFGSMESVGTGPGRGYSVNVPWPEVGMGDGDYLYAFDNVILPIAAEYGPDLIIISAGFDAARGDPLGQNLVSPTGYAHMASRLAQLAGGRLVVALEGGYNVDSIAPSALAVTRVLLGGAPPPLPAGTVASTSARRTCGKVRTVHSRFWTNLADPDADLPDADSDVGEEIHPADVSDDEGSDGDGDRSRRIKRRRVELAAPAVFKLPDWMQDEALTSRATDAELVRLWREYIYWEHFGLTPLTLPERPIYATAADVLNQPRDVRDDSPDDDDGGEATDEEDKEDDADQQAQNSHPPLELLKKQRTPKPPPNIALNLAAQPQALIGGVNKATFWPVPATENDDPPSNPVASLCPSPLVHALVPWDIYTAGHGMPTDPCGSGVGHTQAAPKAESGYRAVMLFVHDAGAYHTARNGREGGTPLARTGFWFNGDVPEVRESSLVDDVEEAAYQGSNYVSPDPAQDPPGNGGGYMALHAWAKANRVAVVDVCALVAPVLSTPGPRQPYSEAYTGLSAKVSNALSSNHGKPVYTSTQDAITLATIAAFDASVSILPASLPRILVGGGSAGVDAIVGLLAARGTQNVKAVVQFAGMGAIPMSPPEPEELKSFYATNSVVFVPRDHSYHSSEKKQGNAGTRLGRLYQSEHRDALRMVGYELDLATRFLTEKLGWADRPASAVATGSVALALGRSAASAPGTPQP